MYQNVCINTLLVTRLVQGKQTLDEEDNMTSLCMVLILSPLNNSLSTNKTVAV